MRLGYLNQGDEGPHVMQPRRPWQPIHDSKIWDARSKILGIKLVGSNPLGFRFKP